MSNHTPSESTLEHDIADTRDRLARTIDELTVRAAPKNVAARQAESAKRGFYQATRTPNGDLRMDRVAMAAAALVGVVVLKALSSRRKARSWERQREKRSWS